MDLPILIADVLEHIGFIVDRDSIPLKARKGDETYCVIIIRNREEIETLKQMKISGKNMIISLIRDMEETGDLFISREYLEKIVGDMIISRILGEKTSKGGIIASFEDAFAEYREPVAAENPEINLNSMVESAFSTTKELFPFYTYYFSVEDGENSETGILLVNAVDKGVFRAKKPITCDRGGLSALQRLEPSIGDEEGLRLGEKFLIKEHTREEEIIKEEGAVTVMEKKIIGIEKEDIHMKYLGIIYIPVMTIESPEGSLTVDLSGLTG